jgi:hypothetical protein
MSAQLKINLIIQKTVFLLLKNENMSFLIFTIRENTFRLGK